MADKDKECLEAEIEKVNIEIDFKQRDVLSLDVIQQSLLSFSKVINKLSLDDQKELMHLLIREIRVSSFDPKTEQPPKTLGTEKRHSHKPGAYSFFMAES